VREVGSIAPPWPRERWSASVSNAKEPASCGRTYDLHLSKSAKVQFKKLSFKTPNLDVLNGLPNCNGLTSLTLNLGGSGVTSLDALKELKGLTSLTLNLHDSTINALNIRDLTALETLTIMQNNHYELDGLSKSVTTLNLSTD